MPACESAPAIGEMTGRPVELVKNLPAGATVERPDPEDVMAHGDSAEVPAALLEIGGASEGRSFVDWAPVHVVTTATLEHLGMAAARYRPNIVIETDPGTPPFTENEWMGREIRIGSFVGRGLIPTPRCSVPTLAHGDLPREKMAVRRVLEENRIEVPGFGVLPALGSYVTVEQPGRIRIGDPVEIGAAAEAGVAAG